MRRQRMGQSELDRARIDPQRPQECLDDPRRLVPRRQRVKASAGQRVEHGRLRLQADGKLADGPPGETLCFTEQLPRFPRGANVPRPSRTMFRATLWAMFRPMFDYLPARASCAGSRKIDRSTSKHDLRDTQSAFPPHDEMLDQMPADVKAFV